MKKIFVIGILCFFAASFAFAKTVIRVSVPAYTETTKASFEKIAKDYEKKNPDVDIQIEGGSWEAWQQKLTTDFFSGGNADLIFSTRAWVPTLARLRFR